ncbi:hypothetical protein [Calothrix sp. 336/3]|uniref:hypothetical protein n=1 Tax=Calothrix sp. 336/3 TaxID=1337936 RepID=UPI0004E2AFDF|nr:hypothetical protein [Calothrix sp. 336/3]AKG21484.1 hypothetical protein IJ00_09485 [Calothrix sp. 336/3]
MNKIVRLVIEPKRQIAVNLDAIAYAEIFDGNLTINFVGRDRPLIIESQEIAMPFWRYLCEHSMSVRCGLEKVAVMPE